ncbi:hypothetical protein B0T11DRAFT_296169 [Plectosphaerella cucumerina]|uniref:Uncharacterized protein n=1 Tax=Plectosphaerella cucumerina TaxID=40658 RepID=A0A8K0TKK6_9PEZI|nr:hypothetical protein B0T11DRAFT_296169 [Plectosphaerella cucumerina]
MSGGAVYLWRAGPRRRLQAALPHAFISSSSNAGRPLPAVRLMLMSGLIAPSSKTGPPSSKALDKVRRASAFSWKVQCSETQWPRCQSRQPVPSAQVPPTTSPTRPFRGGGAWGAFHFPPRAGDAGRRRCYYKYTTTRYNTSSWYSAVLLAGTTREQTEAAGQDDDDRLEGQTIVPRPVRSCVPAGRGNNFPQTFSQPDAEKPGRNGGLHIGMASADASPRTATFGLMDDCAARAPDG